MIKPLYCPECQTNVKNDPGNQTSFADHGRCTDCQIKWKNGELNKIMNKEQLKEALLNSTIDSSDLDNIVHDAASDKASYANNGGSNSQVDFLIDVLGWSVEDILSEIKD